MWASDFQYDGTSLSSFGFMISYFDGSTGLEEVEAGTPLNFKTVSTRKGSRFALVDTGYDNALEVTFDICKDPCNLVPDTHVIINDRLSLSELESAIVNGVFIDNETVNLDVYIDEYVLLEQEITDTEYLNLMRWLIRKQFLPMSFIDSRTNITRYYNGAFTRIAKLSVDSRLYGLRLTFLTDRPYALGAEVSSAHTFNANETWNYTDTSYIVGSIIPDLSITCHASGTLKLRNRFTNTEMVISGCTNGETITVKGDSLMLFSSVPAHKIYDCFNYDFLKIGNSISSRINQITPNMACTVTISYKPIIRDAP